VLWVAQNVLKNNYWATCPKKIDPTFWKSFFLLPEKNQFFYELMNFLNSFFLPVI
jgi:hypothetical protein